MGLASKSIAASPVNIDSDRICGVQLELKECTLTVSLCIFTQLRPYF